MTDKTENRTDRRILLIAACMAIYALFILGKLAYISVAEGPELRERAENLAVRDIPLDAERGNIYSADGKLLATSMPAYDVYIDPVAPSQEHFDAYIGALSAELAGLLPQRNAGQWLAFIRSKRERGDRYVRLAEDLTFVQMNRMRQFPLFGLGKYKGGMIIEQQHFRKMPLGKIAERTIGYDRNEGQVGLEGSYNHYLSGRDGHRLMQKISNGNWKPLDDENAIEPQNGQDIITTINTRIQDVAHRALLNTLETFEADHGCAVVMEVSTGRILAMVNLGRTSEGYYYEKLNYAVGEGTEPGSTFKLASLMVALDDGVVDTADIVDTEDGIYTIYNRKVKDSNVKYGQGGYGKISLAEAFRLSSNTGMVKAIYPAYKDRPSDFVDRLYQLGLQHTTGIAIRGEAAPKIPTTEDPSWSGTSLPWMIFGYETKLTALQILTLYNAVANDGVMIRPQIVSEIRERGQLVQDFPVEVINPAICSQETLKQLQELLAGVVENGTGKNIRTDRYAIAGKTGTCQLNYWRTDREYLGSFAGYFPAGDPKYSCIVVVNKPNPAKGFYGSAVAAPAFRAIADELYRNSPQIEEVPDEPVELPVAHTPIREIEAILNKNEMPNLVGFNGMEIISLLENMGFKVNSRGAGKVIRQWPRTGATKIDKQTVELTLG